MMGRSHAATGAAAVVLVAPHQPWPVLAAAATVGAAAALLPDLDIESSTVSNSLGPVTRLLSRVVALVSGGHRGGTHSLLALVLVTYTTFLAGLPPPYARAIIVGYAAHLLGDLLTGNGIPLLWPLVRRRQGLPIFGLTGGWREHAAVVATVVGAATVAVAG
jgi:membrane-bound metal-dependent hydrolase YbcI (DUF457 family)